MQKVLWAALAVLLAVSCGSPVKADPEKPAPETPLPLTVENLAGKWVLADDNTKWYEFKADGTCVEKNNTTDNLFYLIKNNAVQLYLDSTYGMAGDTLHIRIFKQYCFISINNTTEKRYNKN